MNHELRTPLNAIIGFSDIIANPSTTPATPERLRDYARLINGAGQDLLRIISAMIDITRLDSGVYDFDAEPLDLEAAVLAAVDAFRQESEGASAVIDVALPRVARCRDRPPRLPGRDAPDPVERGEVRRLESRRGADRDRGRLGPRHDHRPGPGLQPDKLAQIGRNFARADEGLTRTHGGVGLGLSLAGGLMALHGGEIRLESTPGEGTIVTLRLPRAPAVPKQRPHLARPHAASGDACRGRSSPRDPPPCLISTPPPSIALDQRQDPLRELAHGRTSASRLILRALWRNPLRSAAWLGIGGVGLAVFANLLCSSSLSATAPRCSSARRRSMWRRSPRTCRCRRAAPRNATPRRLRRVELLRDIQVELQRRGLFQGEVDGAAGPRTTKAIRDAQAQLRWPSLARPAMRCSPRC